MSSPAMAIWKTRVRYQECDRFGIAHHSSYVPWFEQGRIELLRLLGEDYAAVEAQGLAYPLVELGFRYEAPAHLDTPLAVECGFLAVDRFRVTFGARIQGPERRIARAFSIHALVDKEMNVREIPADFRQLVERHQAPEGFLGRRFGPGR